LKGSLFSACSCKFSLCSALANILYSKCAFHSAFIYSHFQGQKLTHLYHCSIMVDYIDMFKKTYLPKTTVAKP